MSSAIIVVGGTGTGKTTYVKSLLKKIPNKRCIFVYDVNAEYKEFFDYPFMDTDLFMEKTQFINNGVFVLEEATIYLNNRSTDEYLNKLLVRKRHQNNTVIMVFHSMRSIPRYIYELSNFITIFNTSDAPDFISNKLNDDRLLDIMERVKDNATKNKYYNETLKIY